MLATSPASLLTAASLLLNLITVPLVAAQANGSGFRPLAVGRAPPANTPRGGNGTFALHEPPNGKHYIGAWLDTADSRPGANDGDRPILFNRRMGFNSSLFQYAQDLPIPANGFAAPDEQVKETGTDTILFLTVYPRPNPANITDEDIAALVRQCRRLTVDERRRVLIRFGAEMNGNWNDWGQQPTLFRALWIRVHDALKAGAPLTGMVWAPSSGNGYPYSADVRLRNQVDFAIMDTNKDGVIDARDDPYEPFYPGDEYVEWVALSVYHYGPTWPWLDNTEAELGKFEAIMNQGDFYLRYSVQKGKPMMIAEGAASFHTDTPRGPGVGELAMKRSWWREWLTNRTFYEAHPLVKAVCLFEFRKFEEETDRDFRISTNATIRNAFLQDLEPVRELYVLANLTNPGAVSNAGPADGSVPRGDSPSRNPNSGAVGAVEGMMMAAVWSVVVGLLAVAMI
ncbi:hypothetical protein HK102_003431 [Quaeritorhiza haematococci]|nr:hypothetical protein HK102_003431 [Quaeritorhiza haematococci]